MVNLKSAKGKGIKDVCFAKGKGLEESDMCSRLCVDSGLGLNQGFRG
jgi:hypothetical protein